MWLSEFHRLFPFATERLTGRRLELGEVEREFSRARSSMQVGPLELQILVKSNAWTYGLWWPDLSNLLQEAIQLPHDLQDTQKRRRAINNLHEHLKSIEVVSVVLRFLLPEQFGIMSPAVLSLLNLVPSHDHVESYEDYLDIIQKIRSHYGVLERTADVDMALWSAAQLRFEKDFSALVDEMREDDYFQQVRLNNIIKGLGGAGRATSHQRLLLARAMMAHDHLTAALIASRVYEAMVVEIAGKLGLRAGKKSRQTEVGALVQKLDRERIPESLGLRQGTFERLWIWRNSAIHGEPDITKGNAEALLDGVSQLCERVADVK